MAAIDAINLILYGLEAWTSFTICGRYFKDPYRHRSQIEQGKYGGNVKQNPLDLYFLRQEIVSTEQAELHATTGGYMRFEDTKVFNHKKFTQAHWAHIMHRQAGCAGIDVDMFL